MLWLLAAAAAGEPPAAAGLGLLEAVRMALANDLNLSLEKTRVRSAGGALLAARGLFDPVLSTSVSQVESEEPLSAVVSARETVVSSEVGLTKRFRSGLSLEPGFELLQTESGGADPAAVNVGTVAFTFRQPLLRGRGRAAAAAPELSARSELAASELALRHTTAERVLAVVGQYWVARAAALNLAILLETEARARELVQSTLRLIEADATPAAELVQVEANLAAKEAARIGAERLLFAARQDLGREIGLEGARLAALPLPTDPFPALAPEAAPSLSDAPAFLAAALERRADLRATHDRTAAAEALLRAADNALKPRLDLLFTPSYTGLVEGAGAESFFSPLYRNVPGLSSSLGLNLSWPTFNRQAEGEQILLEALREQSRLGTDRLARQIAADVPTALDAVARHSEQLAKAGEAMRLFERAVENEEKKLRAGSSTLIDVISQRDRLTAARQAEVSAQLALALALARLRFETGTLVAAEGEVEVIAPGQLTTVPWQQGGAAP